LDGRVLGDFDWDRRAVAIEQVVEEAAYQATARP